MLANEVKIGADPRSVGYTVSLTEAAENGAITPDDYARRRARAVGQGNILENVVIPLLLTLWRRLFREGESRR